MSDGYVGALPGACLVGMAVSGRGMPCHENTLPQVKGVGDIEVVYERREEEAVAFPPAWLIGDG
jgi:hypothetical protein